MQHSSNTMKYTNDKSNIMKLLVFLIYRGEAKKEHKLRLLELLLLPVPT